MQRTAVPLLGRHQGCFEMIVLEGKRDNQGYCRRTINRLRQTDMGLRREQERTTHRKHGPATNDDGLAYRLVKPTYPVSRFRGQVE